ncbi:ABC transporter substrate-binding protein [Streptantibioticus silvisoli]|uniref:ABC transporter substrate-binding protein n=1 Tax=Streptantibioticus silvisoli TaxID=2705255 RepID=A0ABT6VX79_9ACTN|nr:ABC transporter substrate-binding protein [Streptantibioticus silvisoli]MDI5963039.1 ABC transporter substrate-binding protein [Streptantibioticus silvisoli]
MRSARAAGRGHPPRRALLRFGGLLVPAVAAPALLTGCGTDPAGAAGNVLRVSQSGDPKTMDPHKQGDMTSMNALINMFDTLTTHDLANRLRPRLALSWTARDEHTWRFRLRPGVTFHNGEPCDAAAVKFSVERVLDPKTESPIVELRYVKDVTVVDRLTVDLHTTQHDPILPAKLSLFGGVVVPPKYIADVGSAGFAQHPVGTGAFTFVHWQPDQELRMRANPRYWNGRPAADQLVFTPEPNSASALAALQSGQTDLVAGLTPDAAQQLAGYTGVTLESDPGIRTAYLSLDTLHGPLRDRRVRQALNHAIDVPLLIKAVLGGKAREVPAMIPRGAFGFDPSLKAFSRSVPTARALLAEAGYPHGFSTTLTASNLDSDVAQAISGLLARAGVHASVNLLDPGTYATRLTSDNRGALGPVYLAASTVWTLDGESMLQSNVRSDRRQSRWHNAQADRLVDAEELSVDSDARMRAFTDLQRLMLTEAPFVSLYQLDNILARNSRPRWRPGAAGSLDMATAEVSR